MRLCGHDCVLAPLKENCSCARCLRPHVKLACERQGVPRETNAALLEAVNASGKAFLIHTELGQGDAKQFMIRMAIGATNTQVQYASIVVLEAFGMPSAFITNVHIGICKPA